MTELSEQDRAVLREVTWKDPKRMSGTLCFRGTRVPVQNLTDYLKHGHPLEYFLEGFPSVEREQATRFLDLAASIASRLAVEEGDREDVSHPV